MAAKSGKANFDTKSYLSTWYKESFEPCVARIAQITELYKAHCLDTLLDTDVKVLEIGSGATINSAVALAPYISSVILSAYEEEGIREAKLWKDQSPEAFNWCPFISALLRHNGEDISAEEREKEIRRKIVDIVPCDLKKPEIISPMYVPERGFDVVVSIGVFCVAASSIEEFYWMFQNIYSLLRPGGFFLCRIVGRVSQSLGYVKSESSEIPTNVKTLYITKDDVDGALKGAGFDIKVCSVHPVGENVFSELSNMKEAICFVAAKP